MRSSNKPKFNSAPTPFLTRENTLPKTTISLTTTSGSSCLNRFPQISSTNAFHSLVDSMSSLPTLSHQHRWTNLSLPKTKEEVRKQIPGANLDGIRRVVHNRGH